MAYEELCGIPSFDTADELWLHAAELVRDKGEGIPSRDGGCREVLGFCARVLDPRAGFMFNPVRKLCPHYVGAEVLWYLSGDDSIDMIKAYAPQYERFSHDGKTAYGAYGKRWATYHQIEFLLKILREQRNTRQAVITSWYPSDVKAASSQVYPDMPCTLSLNFIVRQQKLYLHVTMRSNDIWLGLPNDMAAFTFLQQLIAGELGLDVGWYQHSAMSLHVYDRNWDKFVEASDPPAFDTGSIESGPTGSVYPANVKAALETEKYARDFGACSFVLMDQMGRHSVLSHLVLMAACKWCEPISTAKRISDKRLSRYVEDYYAARKASQAAAS